MPESLLHSISFSLAKRAYCHNLGACSCTPEIQIMKKLSFSILILIILTPFLTAQKAISLEDIWRDYTFYPKSVPGFRVLNDGQHYTRLEDNAINQYSLATGEQTTTIFQADMVRGEGSFSGKIDGYTFSDDEQRILIQTDNEQIYRRSSRGTFYVWDRENSTITPLSENGKQLYATFSPNAQKVAFVRDNNMFVKDLNTGTEKAITTDGQTNSIINGTTDWVYEEEFAFVKAFQWSPDGKKIAYMRFDESEVREFTMTMHRDDAYPEYVTFKYPKVGEQNAIVTVHIYDITSGTTTNVALGDEWPEYYIPRISWTKDTSQLCIFYMNRHQNDLRLLLADAETGRTRVLLRETNPYYIDVDDDLTFLEDGKHFIWTSEQDGYNQIYLYTMDGEVAQKLTPDAYDVTAFYGVDEANGMVYYQAAEPSPLERHVYAVNLKGRKKTRLTSLDGWNDAQFSSTFDYFVLTHSTVNSAPVYAVYDRSGAQVRLIEDNAGMADLQGEYGWSQIEFFSFTTSEGVELNGKMIQPAAMEEGKKYPVMMFVYGGPGSQTVKNQWDAFNHWWFQMLAQQGYVVVSVDNRGTGARGQEFKKMTYQQLGKFETIDQIETARYLGSLPYIDADRIGIWGWSYGGYMSSLCILKGNDVFKSAIAVAPVTNWKWYDTIYTERYMRTDDENPEGYKDNSPVYFADRLKGNYLLIHGMADDNVHFQNAAEMANALVRHNKQFETYFYPNRNHGIFGGLTRLHLYTKMTNFITSTL